MDDRITKKRVTMRSIVASDTSPTGFVEHLATDFVRPDFLDEYVSDAKLRWQSVNISEEPDAGDGGYDGVTHVPAHLNHPLAGQTFAATEKEG